MDRKQFLKSMAVLPLAGAAMKLNALNKMTAPLSSTEKMPVLFLGHGSPMNAIEENEFVTGFRNIGKTISKPNAILCVSAHWETRGTFVTAMEKPQTIHDFGGFRRRYLMCNILHREVLTLRSKRNR
jgi:4,5-DOPA dioxygenase extradiol